MALSAAEKEELETLEELERLEALEEADPGGDIKSLDDLKLAGADDPFLAEAAVGAVGKTLDIPSGIARTGVLNALATGGETGAAILNKVFGADIDSSKIREALVPSLQTKDALKFRDNFPTLVEGAERLGIPGGGSLSDILPESFFSKTGEGLPLQKDGPLDITARGAIAGAGDIGIDILTTLGGASIGRLLQAGGKAIKKSAAKDLVKGSNILKKGKDADAAAELLVDQGLIKGGAKNIEKNIRKAAGKKADDVVELMEEAKLAGGKADTKAALAGVDEAIIAAVENNQLNLQDGIKFMREARSGVLNESRKLTRDLNRVAGLPNLGKVEKRFILENARDLLTNSSDDVIDITTLAKKKTEVGKKISTSAREIDTPNALASNLKLAAETGFREEVENSVGNILGAAAKDKLKKENSELGLLLDTFSAASKEATKKGVSLAPSRFEMVGAFTPLGKAFLAAGGASRTIKAARTVGGKSRLGGALNKLGTAANVAQTPTRLFSNLQERKEREEEDAITRFLRSKK